MIDSDWLPYENNLVWLEDPNSFDYVRETFHMCRRRVGSLKKQFERVIGYTELRRDAPSEDGRVYRRIFYLMPHDRNASAKKGPYHDGGGPMEAVDPRTIAIGVRGIITEKAWGGSIPQL